MQDFSILTDVNASSFTTQQIGVHLTSVPTACIERVVMQTGLAGNRINQGFVLDSCVNVNFDHCDLRCYVNGIVAKGSTAAVQVTDTVFSNNSGSGAATLALSSWKTHPQTLGLTNVLINGGDNGMIWTSTTGGANPAFASFNNVQVNNVLQDGFVFDNGSEVWLNQCWVSVHPNTSYAQTGMLFGANFQGEVYMSQCTFQAFSGHSLFILGGKGYNLSQCTFGFGPKATANTYDEINVGNPVDRLTINGCHFNVDVYNGLSGTNPARSAITIDSSTTNVLISGSQSQPAASYASGKALRDFSSSAVVTGCIGL